MDETLVQRLIGDATLAPSIHNTQPWRFEVRGGAIEVYADRSRQLPVIDPTGRQLTVSCGAAIEQLRLAAVAAGYETSVALLPNPADADHLATVRLGGLRLPTTEEVALARAIARRHTQRRPFTAERVSDEAVEQLLEDLATTGAWARPLRDSTEEIAAAVLLSRADDAERHDEAYWRELGVWRHDDGSDGIPSYAVVPAKGRPSTFPLRDFGSATDSEWIDTPPEHPLVLVIGTAGDDPRDWLLAGRALARLLLRATTLGLVCSPLNQVLDNDGYRAQFRGLLAFQGYPQMMLRVGYGEGATATPRRPVESVLTVSASVG